MAFVARRNVEGKLVECQVISGHGTSSALQLSDQSDDDNDLGSMDTGYSNRSFKSPTVRYVSSKEQLQEDSEPDNCYSFDESECSELTELGDLDSPNSTDSPDTYFDEYEGTGTDEPDDDEQISIETEVECSVSKQLMVENTVLEEEEEEEEQSPNNLDTLSMESFDVDTIPSARDELRLPEQDNRSIDSFDVSTVCRQSIQGDMESLEVVTICQPKQFEDNSSMVSTDVSTICRSKGGQSKGRTFDDTISLDSCNSVSMVRPKKKKQGIALDSISTSTFECQSQDTNRTYNVHSNTVRRDDCSSASTCSWTDMYGGALQTSDSRSNIVPSLSLNLSNTSSGSTTYFRNCDDKKERQGQAYQEWVKRKERQKQEKKQAAIQERQKREAETAMRQRLAKERYQEWIRQKELQQKKGASSSAKSSNSSASYQSNSSIQIANNGHKRQVSKETTEADKKRREQWERMKKVQEQRERERLRLLRITQQKLEEQRKEKSDGAWKNWMKSVGKRAKPVPLNQGFDTLRGTIANIYINPNQWVSNIDTNDSRGN